MNSRLFTSLRIFLLLTFLALLSVGCGSNSSTTDNDTGSVTAKLIWDANSNSTLAKATDKAVAGVVAVRVIVSGPDMTDIQTDVSETDGSCVINGIPAGSGRTVKVLGLGANSLVKYQTEVGNITIRAGQVTDAGTIIMQQIVYVLSGQVQKGPLIFGSSIWVSELDASLNPNGKTYLAQTNDDLGNFYVGPNIGSNLVELLGEGYYMDELTGGLSTSPITLRAIADLSVYPTPIINILTTLQKPRIKSLILKGQTYQAAMLQSQSEALAAFGIDSSKISSFKSLSAMQINGTTDQDAVLLATSAILSKMATNAATANGSSQAAELTYYLSRIASDIQINGSLTNPAIIAARNLAAIQLDLAAVRTNVEAYYASRGTVVVAPRFEEWVDNDGSGILPRRMVPVTGLSFTDVSGVEPQYFVTSDTITVSGLGAGVAAPVTASAGTTIIKNGTEVSGTITTAKDGDTIALRVVSQGYGLTSSSMISIGSSSVVWKVTTKRLGGTVSGLAGSGLVLQNNGADMITIPAGGTSFTFPASAANGASYNVSVFTQPTSPLQDCTVTNGTGTVGAGTSNIGVVCSAVEIGYVQNGGSNYLSVYKINTGTGAIASMGRIDGVWSSSVAIDPSGRFLYSVDNNGLSLYSIDVNTGALTSLGTAAAGNFGGSSKIVAFDPTGRFLYAIRSGNVSAYSIDPNTGALTGLGTVAAGNAPNCIAVDATGRFVYVVNNLSNDVSIFSINATTGALTSRGTVATEVYPGYISLDPTGKFAFVVDHDAGNVSVYSIEASTGALTGIGSVSTGNPPGYFASVVVHDSGKYVYVINFFNKTVTGYSINSSTGGLTSVGTKSTDISPAFITVDPTGKFVYVLNRNSSTVSAYSINASTGALTSVGAAATGASPHSMAIARVP